MYLFSTKKKGPRPKKPTIIFNKPVSSALIRKHISMFPCSSTSSLNWYSVMDRGNCAIHRIFSLLYTDTDTVRVSSLVLSNFEIASSTKDGSFSVTMAVKFKVKDLNYFVIIKPSLKTFLNDNRSVCLVVIWPECQHAVENS